MQSSQTIFDPKRNSIGFLRLVLALTVIYAHAFELGGLGHDFIFHLSGKLYTIAGISVDAFFAFSGYLITASYVRLKSLPLFLWHRILRLLPAYWVCLTVVGIAFSLLLGRGPSSRYITHNLFVPFGSVGLIITNIIFSLLGLIPDWSQLQDKLWLMGQDRIPPLLIHNLFPNAINGSLWTLAPEFRCYMIVGLLGFIGLLSRRFTLGLFLFFWAANFFHVYRHPDSIGSSYLRFPAHFLAGAAFYFWKPPLNPLLALSSVVVAAGTLIEGFYPLVSPITTAYLFFWLAAVLPFQGVGRVRDYSYGIYIYAFPVQQTLSAYGFNRWGFSIYFLLSVAFTIPLAPASWHLIEKPALKWKDAFSKKTSHA